MSIEKPESKSNPEYQSVEQIILKEVEDNNSSFFIEIDASPEDSKEDIENMVRDKLIEKNWWLKKEWQEKGLPQEQIDIELGDGKIILYNFGLPLKNEYIKELKEVIRDFSRIKIGSEKQIKYILIDNERKTNPSTIEEKRGDGSYVNSAMLVYPKGVESGNYRSEETNNFDGVSNFKGTIIHELAHLIGSDFVSKWIKKFKWKMLEEAKSLPGGSITVYEPNEPERCVSDYAKINPTEDICESLVAVLTNPDALDAEKLKFIQEELFENKELPQVNIHKKAAGEIELPKIDSNIYYRINRSSIKIKWRDIN